MRIDGLGRGRSARAGGTDCDRAADSDSGSACRVGLDPCRVGRHLGFATSAKRDCAPVAFGRDADATDLRAAEGSFNDASARADAAHLAESTAADSRARHDRARTCGDVASGTDAGARPDPRAGARPDRADAEPVRRAPESLGLQLLRRLDDHVTAAGLLHVFRVHRHVRERPRLRHAVHRRHVQPFGRDSGILLAARGQSPRVARAVALVRRR